MFSLLVILDQGGSLSWSDLYKETKFNINRTDTIITLCLPIFLSFICSCLISYLSFIYQKCTDYLQWIIKCLLKYKDNRWFLSLTKSKFIWDIDIKIILTSEMISVKIEKYTGKSLGLRSNEFHKAGIRLFRGKAIKRSVEGWVGVSFMK